MTYKDILIQIVSESTDTPEQQIRDTVEAFLKLHPKSLKIHKDVSPAEAEQLLADLRKEKLQIRARIANGGIAAVFRHYGNA